MISPNTSWKMHIEKHPYTVRQGKASLFIQHISATRQLKVLYIKCKSAKETHNKMTFRHTILKQVIQKQEKRKYKQLKQKKSNKIPE